MTAIHVHRACLSLEGRQVFRDLELVLPARRLSCLLGASGVGKTSLLRLIAGLVAAETPGAVTDEAGQAVAGRFAYMAQQDLLLPWATVLDNVLIGPRLRGERPNPDQALALLRQVGLHGQAQRRPAALSGGMRQRVALARTLMEDRPVVLMDEPFSAVDAVTRMALQDLAVRLLRGRTVLLVTHDPLEALRIADHILVMSGCPARLDAPLAPPGAPPRSLQDPGMADLHATLLDRLIRGSDRSETRP